MKHFKKNWKIKLKNLPKSVWINKHDNIENKGKNNS